jgi:hypothetical protein
MPRVQVSIQDFPACLCLIFIRDGKAVGPTRRFTSQERAFELLRRAHANLETINVVENALRERRPSLVDLNLTDEQYLKLQSRNGQAHS